ncbi:hypothetical protein DBR33_05015, partial [Stenotrophomonas sp. HMWF022]
MLYFGIGIQVLVALCIAVHLIRRSQPVDPNHLAHQARSRFKHSPTHQNRLQLATALLNAGQAQEARSHFEQAASGASGITPEVLLGLARARLETRSPVPALEALAMLFATHPQARRQPEPTLLYAQAMAATHSPGTRTAFNLA